MFTPNTTSFELFPFLEDGEMVIDSTINGVPCSQVRQKLEMLFTDFLDYRRGRYESDIAPEFRVEVIEMIALLRTIAREMEVEIDGATH